MGSPAGGQRVQAVDRLDEHEPPGARGAGHPRGDRVRRDGPRGGQRVALAQQRVGSSTAAPAGAGRGGAARRTRDEVRERPAELVHREDRHPVGGLVAQPERRSCTRTASANFPPPGTTSSGWRAPPRAIAAHSARSAPSPPSRASPPPTLTTVSTPRAPGPRRAPRAPRRGPRRARPRSTASRRRVGRGAGPPRGRGTRPTPSGTTGAPSSATRGRTLARGGLDLPDLLGVEYAAIASISRGASCSVSAHTRRATRSRAPRRSRAGRPASGTCRRRARGGPGSGARRR